MTRRSGGRSRGYGGEAGAMAPTLTLSLGVELALQLLPVLPLPPSLPSKLVLRSKTKALSDPILNGRKNPVLYLINTVNAVL